MARPAEIAPRLIAALVRPGQRPVGLQGPSGRYKTTLLRRLLSRETAGASWSSASDLTHEMTAAMREERYSAWRDALCADDRPLCVEHVEDLRGLPRTREEVKHLLTAAAARRRVVVTLTRSRSDGAVVRWLRSWADVYSLD